MTHGAPAASLDAKPEGRGEANGRAGMALNRRATRVFITHSGADQAWAGRMARLLRRLGAEVFAPSADPAETRRRIAAADWLVLTASPRAARSDLVAAEIETFGRPERVVALVVDGDPMASRHEDLAHQECLPKSLRAAPPPMADIRDDRDGWPAAGMALAARILGVTPAAFAASRRRRRRLAFGAAAAAAALAGAGLFALERRDGGRALAALDAKAEQAITLLDAGDRLGALRLAAGIMPEAGAPASPLVRAAVSRVASETRLLADMPAPAQEIVRLKFAPDGALIAVAADQRVFLVDIGAEVRHLAHDPDPPAFMALSDDGRALWSARFGAVRRSDEGDYAPVIFEDVDLVEGRLADRREAASPPVAAPEGAISPDGALFAVDLGPGASDQTVIAVYRRDAKALSAVLTLPSDRARIRFLGPDRLLARVDPPGAVGLHLWRVGEAAPRALRAPGAQNGCGDRAPAPGAHGVAPDGAEIALISGGGAGGACVEIWSGEGAPLAAWRAETDRVTVLRAGGPYLLSGGEGAWLADAAGARVASARGCDGEAMLSETMPGAPLLICAGAPEGRLYFGLSGRLGWRGLRHEGGVTAIAHDPERARVATAGRDGRLRIWDAAARGWPEDAAAVAAEPPERADSACAAREASASPDGERIAAAEPGRVVAMDADTCRVVAAIPATPSGPVAWRDPDTLLLPLGGETWAIPLGPPFDTALASLRRRAARLESAIWPSAGNDAKGRRP